jgi:hypothetical protein
LLYAHPHPPTHTHTHTHIHTHTFELEPKVGTAVAADRGGGFRAREAGGRAERGGKPRDGEGRRLRE